MPTVCANRTVIGMSTMTTGVLFIKADAAIVAAKKSNTTALGRLAAREVIQSAAASSVSVLTKAPDSTNIAAIVIGALLEKTLSMSFESMKPSTKKLAAPATAAPWEEASDSTIGTTAGWSNKVDLADIDGDGDVHILFANGEGYDSPGAPELSRVFLNPGDGGAFTDASEMIFGLPGEGEAFARVIRAHDLEGDRIHHQAASRIRFRSPSMRAIWPVWTTMVVTGE